jgi:hypothetical protein
VVELAPCVGHLSMNSGDLEPGLGPVAGTLGLAGQALLFALELLLRRRRKRGDSTFVPSERTAKWVRPRSIPTSEAPPGSVSSGPLSTTKLAKYLPAASLTTVTVDGTDGSTRDHLTLTLPILGNGSPAVRAVSRARSASL